MGDTDGLDGVVPTQHFAWAYSRHNVTFAATGLLIERALAEVLGSGWVGLTSLDAGGLQKVVQQKCMDASHNGGDPAVAAAGKRRALAADFDLRPTGFEGSGGGAGHGVGLVWGVIGAHVGLVVGVVCVCACVCVFAGVCLRSTSPRHVCTRLSAPRWLPEAFRNHALVKPPDLVEPPIATQAETICAEAAEAEVDATDGATAAQNATQHAALAKGEDGTGDGQAEEHVGQEEGGKPSSMEEVGGAWRPKSDLAKSLAKKAREASALKPSMAALKAANVKREAKKGAGGTSTRARDLNTDISKERRARDRQARRPPSPGDDGLQPGDMPVWHDVTSTPAVAQVGPEAEKPGRGSLALARSNGALAMFSPQSGPRITAESALGGFMGTVGASFGALFGEAQPAVQKVSAAAAGRGGSGDIVGGNGDRARLAAADDLGRGAGEKTTPSKQEVESVFAALGQRTHQVPQSSERAAAAASAGQMDAPRSAKSLGARKGLPRATLLPAPMSPNTGAQQHQDPATATLATKSRELQAGKASTLGLPALPPDFDKDKTLLDSVDTGLRVCVCVCVCDAVCRRQHSWRPACLHRVRSIVHARCRLPCILDDFCDRSAFGGRPAAFALRPQPKRLQRRQSAQRRRRERRSAPGPGGPENTRDPLAEGRRFREAFIRLY